MIIFVFILGYKDNNMKDLLKPEDEFQIRIKN